MTMRMWKSVIWYDPVEDKIILTGTTNSPGWYDYVGKNEGGRVSKHWLWTVCTRIGEFYE